MQGRWSKSNNQKVVGIQITSVPYRILEPGLFYGPMVLALILSVFRQYHVWLRGTQLVTLSLFLASINYPRRPVCTIYCAAFFANHVWFKIALKLWGWLLYGQTAFLSSLKLGHLIRTCRPVGLALKKVTWNKQATPQTHNWLWVFFLRTPWE